jgi:hypothetical protein
VSLLATFDEPHGFAIFVGRAPARAPRPASLWDKLRRRPHESPPGIHRLDRYGSAFGVGVRRLPGVRSPRAVAGWPGPWRGDFGLVAFERASGAWTAVWRDRYAVRENRDLALDVPADREVVGVVGEIAGDDGTAALVVRNATKDGLWLLDPGGRTTQIAQATAPLREVAFSLVEPIAACVVGEELRFLWLPTGRSG